MALCEKYLLAGFSGAGKSSLISVLKANAPHDWDHFADLDQLVFKNHGKGFATLAELIEAKGWESFRLWERQELEGWLKQEGKGVLALGGGALSPLVWEMYGKNKKIGFCYLKVPFEVAWNRLLLDSEEARPLVKLGKARLEQIFLEREQIYKHIPWHLDGTKNLQMLAKDFWNVLSIKSDQNTQD